MIWIDKAWTEFIICQKLPVFWDNVILGRLPFRIEVLTCEMHARMCWTELSLVRKYWYWYVIKLDQRVISIVQQQIKLQPPQYKMILKTQQQKPQANYASISFSFLLIKVYCSYSTSSGYAWWFAAASLMTYCHRVLNLTAMPFYLKVLKRANLVSTYHTVHTLNANVLMSKFAEYFVTLRAKNNICKFERAI